MRKLSKILAIVFTLSLVLSACVIIASAAGNEQRANLRPKNADVYSTADFDVQSVTFTKYGDDLAIGTSSQTNPDGTEKNSFAVVSDGTYSKKAYTEYKCGETADKFGLFDYLLFDFDIASNEYKYSIGDNVYYGTSLPENAENVSLNYPTGMEFRPFGRSSSNSNFYPCLTLYVVSDGKGDFYLSSNSSYSENDKKLSNVLGAWNHVTFILRINHGDPGKSSFYAYINGSFLCEKSLDSDSQYKNAALDDLYLDSVRFQCPEPASASNFNFCLDNVSNYRYKKGYVSEGYGIDDYFLDPDFKNKDIIDCEDIVYNNFYSYYGTPNLPPIKIEKTNGTEVKCFMPGAAFASIESGDHVITSFSFTGFTPKLGTSDLTIEAIDGAKVTLSKEAQTLYRIQKYKDVYKIKLANEDDGIKLEWYGDETDGLLKEQILLPFVTPSSEVAAYDPDPDFENKKLRFVTGWKWDLDGDGTKYSLEDPKSFTVAEFFELKEIDKIDKIVIKAQVETKDFCFVVMQEDGEIFRPGGSYEIYTDFANFKSAVAQAPDKSTIKLLSDSDNIFSVSLNNSSIPISKNFTITVDLNGYVLSHNETAAPITESSPLFTLAEGATLNLISSVEGGKIFQAQARSVNDAIVNSGASGIVEIASGVDSATVNFGTSDGENTIDVNGGTVVNVLSNSDMLTNFNKIKINIYGGNFYANADLDHAMFAVKAPDVEITINNANIYNAAENAPQYAIFTDYPGCDTSGQKIVATNSKFIALSTDGNTECKLFSNPRALNAYFENCVLMGQAFYNEAAGYTITLGKDVQVAGSAAQKVGNGLNVELGVNAAFNSDASYNAIVPLSYPAINYNSLSSSKLVLDNSAYIYGGEVNKTKLLGVRTFVGELPQNVSKVEFLTPDDKVYATEYIFVNNYIDVNKYPASVFGNKELENGWYDLAYDTWQNTTAGQEANSVKIVEGDNEFVPVATTPVANVLTQVNTEFFDRLAYNFYFTAPEASMNITFDITGQSGITGFFVGDYSIKNNPNAEATLYKFSNYFAVDEFTSPTITVKFKVNYNSVDYDLNQTFVFDLFEYFENASAEYACGTDEGKLMIAFMQFKFEQYKAAHPTAGIQDPIYFNCENAINAHGPACTCLALKDQTPTPSIEETEVDFTALSANAEDIAYYVTKDGKIDFVVYTAPDSAITALSAKVGEASSLELVKTEGIDYDGDGVAEVEYRLSGIDVADAAKIITIDITTDSGDLQAKYSLAKEINTNTLAKVIYIIATTPAN